MMSVLSGASNPPSPDGLQYRARSYQLEMLEESLRANIIVAMDTGSGKTHISLSGFCKPLLFLTKSCRAVLRIMAELDRCPPEKLVWFLAPTVALCTQQHAVISLQLPAARTRLLIGSDNVDRWSEQRIWDAALRDVQIVVSTHAVLADSLGHGFVKMSKLALLIFDEAHHCARGHPANKIMRDFYHRAKQDLAPVPSVLGLTASPVKSSKPKELRTIEANLDSTSITPRLHRQELLKYVHHPTLIRIGYLQYDAASHICNSRLLRDLNSICHQANITTDLYPLKLQSDHATKWKQRELFLTGEKFCADQLKSFRAKAQHVYEQLGPWAADYFIIESIKKFKKTVNVEKGLFVEWQSKEKAYLLEILAKIEMPDFSTGDTPEVSSKLERLISFLSDNKHPGFSGLVFVQQRATVTVMSELLSTHPRTRDHFRCAPYVGLSNSANRKQNIGELLDPRAMCETLDDFRNRRKNLIISTDVLEEGIDITACHMVICFDKIPNLKSFIQRRGRARQEKSTYAVMVASDGASAKLDDFQDLEEEMLRVYQDEARLRERVSAPESIEEDVMDEFRVECTEALLTANTAIAHIHHFCNTLPRQPYVDLRPTFTFSEDYKTNLINATVTLPSCLKSSVRRTSGLRWWQTEHAAMKDAAFQAYVGLYRAHLLTDNLLPFPHERVIEGDVQDKLTSTIDIQAQFSPWVGLAKAWAQPNLHQTEVSIKPHHRRNEAEIRMVLTTPGLLPSVPSFNLYWDNETTFTASLASSRQATPLNSADIRFMQDIMHTLLRSTHSDYMPDSRKDFTALFTPEIDVTEFGNWLNANQGRRPALQQFQLQHHSDRSLGLVRPSLLHGIPHVFHQWHMPTDVDVIEETEVQIECLPLTRRRNFLQRATLSERTVGLADQVVETEPKMVRLFPANLCTIDLLPFEQAKFALFIPSILQHVEMCIVATQLQQKVLKGVYFNDIQHVIEAITASSVQWVTNYQRYEFVGDSILKFLVTSQLFVDHNTWHEGYLSQRRASLVSNTCLARAALDAGIDEFIITKPFTTKQWTPPLISNAKNFSTAGRIISSKTLADVVEALIGAAFVDGGLSVATSCIQAILPGHPIQSPEFRFGRNTRSASFTNLSTSAQAESVIGYQFLDRSLLQEALTHPSCERDTVTESYQRLEFLGDAILDMIVVSVLSKHKPPLSHGAMTRVKAALVNADFLAFLCLEFSITYDIVNIQQKKSREFYEVHADDHTELWRFMRHHSQEIMAAQQACRRRHESLRQEIQNSLKRGTSYPWDLLAQLNADKFFSDLIESVIGAIFVDSGGILVYCQRFAERIGLMPYLLRILSEDIEISHPKTALERLTGSGKVEYVLSCEEGASNLYRCLVRINDADVTTVGECLTKNEALVRAAHAAVKLLTNTQIS